MESRFFTPLTANEESNVYGGKKNSHKTFGNGYGKGKVTFFVYIYDSVIQFIGGTGGQGGTGGSAISANGLGSLTVNGGTLSGGGGGTGGAGGAAFEV